MTQQTQTLKGKPAKKQAKDASVLLSESTDKYKKVFQPNQDEMHAMIAKEAYLLAERRGFEGDKQLEDWVQAETAITSRFTNKH
jgi:hypothetical protein